MKKTKAVGIEIEMGPIEQEDFDGIVSQNQKRIYRTLLLLIRDADAAEVLTQECSCCLRPRSHSRRFAGFYAVERILICRRTVHRQEMNCATDFTDSREIHGVLFSGRLDYNSACFQFPFPTSFNQRTRL
jgi:hypothetical protein